VDPTQWLAGFRELHAKHKQTPLADADLRRYHNMREELARSLVAAQGLTVPEGQNARRYFRVAQVLPLELNNLHKSVTRDISRIGFSAVVQGTFKEGERLSFIITLARGVEAATGSAHVVTSVRQQGSSRVSFAIDHLDDAAAERLEVALFDAVLSRLK
jgi:hypothetical protein